MHLDKLVARVLHAVDRLWLGVNQGRRSERCVVWSTGWSP